MSVLLLLLWACRPVSSDPSDSDPSDSDPSDSDPSDSDPSDSGGPTGSDGGATSTDGGTETGTDGGTADGGTADGGTELPLPPVVVNELMADNEGIVTDDDGAVADWIELYNGGDEAVDLSGYGVTDDWTRPLQHTLPDGTVLDAGGYLLLWADGSKLPTGSHLPFRLDGDGEAVGLFTPDGRVVDWVVFGYQRADTALARMPDGAEDWEEMQRGTPGASNQRLVIVEEEVVSSGATWRYWDSGLSPGEGWTERDFDDSSWAEGPAPLGYGDPVATVISYGPDANDKHATAWFRTRFELAEDGGELAGATLSLRVDDGAAAYVDGVEVVRHNLPDGELTADTYASGTTSTEDSFVSFDLDLSALEPGEVVLAVEVHQASGTSSDTVLDAVLSLERLVAED